jgi:hypothetical protein
MEKAKEILTELQEIAPFLSKGAVSRIPYAVPGGFFNSFPELLIQRIRLNTESFSGPETKAITGLSTQFEISPLEEIADISPLLAGLQKKNPYQAPYGYFESLNTIIPAIELSSVRSESKQADLVVLPPTESQKNTAPFLRESYTSQGKSISFWTPVMRYAVAACIVALIGITVFKVVNPGKPDPLNGLTTVSDQDMANYLDADDIHWTPGLAPETASVDFSDSDIHALFSNVSDAELQEYIPALPSGKGTVN